MTPLVAVLDEAEESPDGLRQDKSSHMASVSLVAADGRRGLLAFSSVQSMAAWDPAARGIPALGATVAAGALDEGADAVLLDLAGPVRVALDGALLRALGHRRAAAAALRRPVGARRRARGALRARRSCGRAARAAGGGGGPRAGPRRAGDAGRRQPTSRRWRRRWPSAWWPTRPSRPPARAASRWACPMAQPAGNRDSGGRPHVLDPGIRHADPQARRRVRRHLPARVHRRRCGGVRPEVGRRHRRRRRLRLRPDLRGLRLRPGQRRPREPRRHARHGHRPQAADPEAVGYWIAQFARRDRRRRRPQVPRELRAASPTRPATSARTPTTTAPSTCRARSSSRCSPRRRSSS